MLHIGRSDRIDATAVERTVRLITSTSPSSLMLASLDGARRHLAVHGEALLHATLGHVRAAREKLATAPGIAVIGPEQVGRPGVADWDPMRIVLDVRATGRTGYAMAEALRDTYESEREPHVRALIGLAVIPAGDLDDGEVGGRRAGRLVDPDEGTGEDTEKDLFGTDVGIDGAAASAEEAAMHVVPEDGTGAD